MSVCYELSYMLYGIQYMYAIHGLMVRVSNVGNVKCSKWIRYGIEVPTTRKKNTNTHIQNEEEVLKHVCDVFNAT